MYLMKLTGLHSMECNGDKRIQSIDSIETYVYGTNQGLVYEKEDIKYNKIIRQYKNI